MSYMITKKTSCRISGSEKKSIGKGRQQMPLGYTRTTHKLNELSNNSFMRKHKNREEIDKR